MPAAKKQKLSKKSIKKTVKAVLSKEITKRAEKKYFDVTTDAFSAAAVTWQIVQPQWFNITQGTAANQRVGDTIQLLGFEVTMRTDLVNATVQERGDLYRCQLWEDSQTNGAAPAVGNLYDPLAAAQIMSLRNPDLKQRFKLLYSRDHVITCQQQLAAGTVTTATMAPKYHKFFVRVNRKIKFTSNAGTLAAVPTFNYFFAHIMGNGSALTPIYYMRVWFTDI